MPAGLSLVEASMDHQGKLAMESSARRDHSRVAGAPDDDDVALVLHTSGTTSRPATCQAFGVAPAVGV
jgi:long-subunit acyl-CoA synthetase (AMP-forming)